MFSKLLFLRVFAASSLVAALANSASGATIVANAVGTGDYYIQSVPGMATMHMVTGHGGIGGTMLVRNNYQSYEWSFGFLSFDLSGQVDEVASALLSLQISNVAGPGRNTSTPVSLQIFALTANFMDTDGVDDGDFQDYDTYAGGEPHYAGGTPPNYVETYGMPEEASAWYESQFGGSATSIGTITFEGNQRLDIGTFDLTSLTNDWISGRTANFGLGFLLVAPDAMRVGIEETLTPDGPSAAPSLTLSAVPEPGTVTLIGLGGMVGLWMLRRRRLA